jgi:hypothetical protein
MPSSELQRPGIAAQGCQCRPPADLRVSVGPKLRLGSRLGSRLGGHLGGMTLGDAPGLPPLGLALRLGLHALPHVLAHLLVQLLALPSCAGEAAAGSAPRVHDPSSEGTALS